MILDHIICRYLSPLVVDAKKLNLEDEGRVARDDGREPTSAVAVVRGNGEDSLLAKAHLRDTLIPTLDDTASTDLGLEGFVPVDGAVEL